MALVFKTTRFIQFEGHKKKWEVMDSDIVKLPSEDGVGVDFIKLRRGTKSLAFPRIVFEGCAELDAESGARISLTASKGYEQLLVLRNEVQSEELLNEQRGNIPAMFRQAAEVKRQRVSRDNMNARIANPTTLIMRVEEGYGAPFELEMLRPVHPRDDLCVKLDLPMLTQIIEYIRNEGFSNSIDRKGDLPPGVRRVSGGRYAYVKVWGQKGIKWAKTLDEAAQGAKDARDAFFAELGQDLDDQAMQVPSPADDDLLDTERADEPEVEATQRDDEPAVEDDAEAAPRDAPEIDDDAEALAEAEGGEGATESNGEHEAEDEDDSEALDAASQHTHSGW